MKLAFVSLGRQRSKRTVCVPSTTGWVAQQSWYDLSVRAFKDEEDTIGAIPFQSDVAILSTTQQARLRNAQQVEAAFRLARKNSVG